MTNTDPKRELAIGRSQGDAQAANALLQAAGQAIILINGGAATAILAFASSDKAIIRIGPVALGVALICFAVGVVAGACVIAFQGMSVQQYIERWEGDVIDYPKGRIDEVTAKGNLWALLSQVTFVIGAVVFFFGAIALSVSLFNSESPPWQLIIGR